MTVRGRVRWDRLPSMNRPDGRSRTVDRDSADLLLLVGNQSFLDNPVVLTVQIDGVEVVSQPFEVRDQHHSLSFPLRLGPGAHLLRVTSDTGQTLEETFSLPADGSRRYGSIDYYNYADEDGMLLDWYFSSMPMGIR
jgi:hypothetical protein